MIQILLFLLSVHEGGSHNSGAFMRQRHRTNVEQLCGLLSLFKIRLV